jgi:hypothetical protein
MSDGTKINPSPPPAEPKDVQVSPSPAPAEPFDVKTYPSLPPSEPFDVKTYPDPPPGGTFDVPNSPDDPPIEPYDVPLQPDGPPIEPYDVSVSPDGPPIEPYDVALLPDGPPIEPYDVQTAPDGPPVEPYDVSVSPNEPPADPYDVPTYPDQEILVGTDGRSLLPDGFDVPTYPDDEIVIGTDGRPLLPDGFEVYTTPSPETLIGTDGRAVTYNGFDVPVNFSPPPFRPEEGDTKKYLDGVAQSLKLFDRGLSAFLTELIDSQRVTNNVAALIEDEALTRVVRTARDDHMIEFISNFVKSGRTAADGNAPNVAGLIGTALDKRENVYSSKRTFNEGQDFSVDEIVDTALTPGGVHPFLTPTRDVTGISTIQKFDAAKYFNDRDSYGGQTVKSIAKARIAGGTPIQTSKLAASNFINGVIRVPISAEEDADGAVYSPTENPADIVDDDDTRIPLCFTDLRKDTNRNAYRSVYFRPLNLSFSKSTSPEYAESSAFGRVDPIIGYQKTTRTYQVSFELHAFAPEDLQVMYHKMTWLDSMCYPTYSNDSLMRSGPVIRLRIGDAVSTESGGLSGVIKSLNFDFSDALWELKKGMKVPRSFKVSADFMALHEGPVGILNGAFGVFRLPPNKITTDVDTTNQGGQSESREGVPRVASIVVGGFSKFGEPKR